MTQPTVHRLVDPWTSPLDLISGDRAVNPGGLVVEWDGHAGVPVCGSCDVAMTNRAGDGSRCCPTCGAVQGRPLPVFGGQCEGRAAS